MDRRQFIKKSALAAAGSVLLSTPLAHADTVESEEETMEETSKKPTNKHNMKVLLINGSPRKKGNTFTALSEAANTLEKNGIETE